MNRRDDVRTKALATLQDFEVLIRDGHFDYGNGYHGRLYMNPHRIFRQPSLIWRLGQDLIDVLRLRRPSSRPAIVCASRAPPMTGPATTSVAECAFATVERGLDAEGGPNEVGLPTFPSRRFVRAGDLTVVHEGLLEYELVDGGRELALTLLRATGMLSRVDLGYRPLPAGPPIKMDGPQLLGPVTVRYAVCVDGDVDPYALVDDVFLPLEIRTTSGGGARPSRGSELVVGGAEVSALRRVPGGLELRAFNPTASATTLTVGDRSGWVIDLLGAPVRPFDGAVALRPWEIVTLLLTAT